MIEALVTRLGAWGVQRHRAGLIRSKHRVDEAVQCALEADSPANLERCLKDYRTLIKRTSAMGFADIWLKVKQAELSTFYELGSSQNNTDALFKCIDGVATILSARSPAMDDVEISGLLRLKGHAYTEIGYLKHDIEAFQRAVVSYEDSLRLLDEDEHGTIARLTRENVLLCKSAMAAH